MNGVVLKSVPLLICVSSYHREQLQTLINTAGGSVTADRSIFLGWNYVVIFFAALDISQVTKEWEARMQYVRSWKQRGFSCINQNRSPARGVKKTDAQRELREELPHDKEGRAKEILSQ